MTEVDRNTTEKWLEKHPTSLLDAVIFQGTQNKEKWDINPVWGNKRERDESFET